MVFRRAAPTIIYLLPNSTVSQAEKDTQEAWKGKLPAGIRSPAMTRAILFKDIHMAEQESSNKVDKESIALLWYC